MSRAKPTCAGAFKFLTLRQGRGALAPCTGQDYRALAAWFHLVEIYGTADDRGQHAALLALASILDAMQLSVWHLAKAGIPGVLDWPDEDRVWRAVHEYRARLGSSSVSADSAHPPG